MNFSNFKTGLTGLCVLLMLPSLAWLPTPANARKAEPRKTVASAFQQNGETLLPIGIKAPDFNLPSTTGKKLQLANYHGKKLLIIFYPMDQTPGCTIQLCALRDEYAKFKAEGIEGIASNPASVESHLKFAQKQHYQFPILSDRDKTMAHDYGVIGLLGMINRTVYIVDSKGVIRYAKRGLPSNQELLEAAKKMR